MKTDAYLQRTFGITEAQRTQIEEFQEGRCAICGKRPRASQPRLAIDHDHVTGLVRGLLCGRCNHDLLGIFGDNPEFYLWAALYLTHPPAPMAVGTYYVPDSVGAETEES